jgi:hypothetical protein
MRPSAACRVPPQEMACLPTGVRNLPHRALPTRPQPCRPPPGRTLRPRPGLPTAARRSAMDHRPSRTRESTRSGHTRLRRRRRRTGRVLPARQRGLRWDVDTSIVSPSTTQVWRAEPGPETTQSSARSSEPMLTVVPPPFQRRQPASSTLPSIPARDLDPGGAPTTVPTRTMIETFRGRTAARHRLTRVVSHPAAEPPAIVAHQRCRRQINEPDLGRRIRLGRRSSGRLGWRVGEG